MELVTIREAATLLGVSPQTVRKRVHGGDLDAELVDGKYGAEWRIKLSDEPRPRDPSAPLDDLGRVIAHQEQIIRRLQVRLALLSQRILGHVDDQTTRDPLADIYVG